VRQRPRGDLRQRDEASAPRPGCRSEPAAPQAAVTHPLSAGGFLCLTTRSNPSNRRYRAELEAALQHLEQKGAWQRVLLQEVPRWERATSEEEECVRGSGYISGVVYIYRKCPVPPPEEG